jgi:hypothetical protein
MTVRELERIATQTVLGVRFWDAAQDSANVAGLDVRAWLLNADRSRPVGRVVPGRPTPNGTYGFFGLYPAAERLPAVTPPEGQLWQTVPPARRAVVEVRDPLERYLSVAFQVEVPVRGPFRGEGAWLARPLLLPPPTAGAARGVQLWTAAGYPPPPGLTVLRAQVVVGSADPAPPAAYARVEVRRLDGDGNQILHAVGLTDAQGRLTLPLSYPPVAEPPVGTPYAPLSEQAFPLRVRAFSRETAAPRLPGSTLPNLEALLGQDAYRIARQHAGPELILVQSLAAELRYGPPLVLRTATSNPERPESVLRIAPEA